MFYDIMHVYIMANSSEKGT